MSGIVKRIRHEKGFGFILGSDGKEYFFHMTALKNIRFEQLEVGSEVEFEDVMADKGLRAEEIFV